MLKPISTAEVNFELGEEIGAEGRNSQVFCAHDLQLDTTLAMKRIEKVRFADVEEFFDEASLLYISSHTNVVPIHYACQDEEYIYLAMPYFEDGSLKSKIAGCFLTIREIVTYSTQFLSGLHNIHSKGLIHFDVKPDNILLSFRDEALIADFGLAKQISLGGVAGQDRVYGKMTPPEAFLENEFTRHFDIYQVGLTLYRMCVGDGVFYADYNQYVGANGLVRDRFRHAVPNGQFPSQNQYPEHIPQKLIDTVRTCLRRNVCDRFPSAIEVVNSFSGLEGNLLDWRLEENNGAREWTKRFEGGGYGWGVAANGSSIATRRIEEGAERRIRDYCRQVINRQEIKRFLRRY